MNFRNRIIADMINAHLDPVSQAKKLHGTRTFNGASDHLQRVKYHHITYNKGLTESLDRQSSSGE